MINLLKFGQIIASERLLQNMTQRQLAEILLVTPQAVSKWERGESFPDIETLVLLCYEYNIDVNYLLNECFDDLTLINEICIENIEECLRSFRRKEVIEKVINNELKPLKIDSIFYLLNIQERRLLIDKVLDGKIEIYLADFIILLSPPERIRFLDGLMNKKSNLDEVVHLLSPFEKRKYDNYVY